MPLNAQLLGKEIEINFGKTNKVLPALYSTLIDKGAAESISQVEGCLAHYLKGYEVAENKEAHLRRFLVDLLFETSEETEPYMGVAAKSFLNLLSRFIWLRAGSP